MTKFSLLGVTSLAVFAALTVPALAQQRKAAPAAYVYAQRDVCAGHEAGNPYSREADYWDWSAWRARGGWDARNDFNCPPRREVR